MLQGETIRSGASQICTCGLPFVFEVLRSNAYYIGTMCHNKNCEHCGEPNSRESHYYRTREEAEKALKSNCVNWRT